jgi:alanyl-tRNA synthetase
VARTGEIGFFRILGESSVGSGLRRIEALTGRGAEEYVETQSTQLRELGGRLGVGVNQIGDRINQLLAQVRQQQNELAQLQRGQSAATLEQLLGERKDVDGISYVAARVDGLSVDALRELGDRIRDKLRSGVVVLGTVVAEKPQIVAMATSDLVARGYHAGKLVKSLAAVVGGGGGGRPDVAQAGGRDSAKLDDALAQVAPLLRQQGRD